MATTASKDVEKGDYFKNFFAQSLRDAPAFRDETSQVFGKITQMMSGTEELYIFAVTCDNDTKFCRKQSYYAHMGDDRRTMNFCDRFFATDGDIKATNDRAKECDSMTLREAHRSKAALLVHETTHTRYAMLYEDPSLDYAYGFAACYQLARGLFDRGCTVYKNDKNPLCGNAEGKDGLCDEKRSGTNADSYALTAAGIYFSDKCNKAIPLPPLPGPLFTFEPTPTLPPATPAASEGTSVVSGTPIPEVLRRRDQIEALYARADCPIYDDTIFDDPRQEIVGYVHFGDSYGAGMGTGTTSGDACRVGENNFGDLLYKSWNDKGIPYERKVCSGDTIKGLNRQIDEWVDSNGTNVGTVSIGGNDVGFSDLVYDCIITPNTARWGSTMRALCTDVEKKARDMMSDQGSDGMKSKLKAAYRRILKKSGRSDFRLYVTSYVEFFNTATTDCDKLTFHYWWAGYNPSSDPFFNRIVYLKQDLRVEIDDLVKDLNKVIESAVTEANKEHGGYQINFVDVNARFNAHRWCEQGDWHEPAPEVDSTWLFLSGWPDVSIEGSSVNTAAIETAEIKQIIDAGRIPLPDADCRKTLDSDADPYLRSLCYYAEAVAESSNGTEATYLAEANAQIESKNVTSQHIGWFTPTRQVKTFHPRSPGMVAYKDAIVESIEQVGQV
ncbi:hypothetical protein HBI56_121730 [Parastagonospora nodorum]|nr:hypothetical protein HBH53_100410 [Parastagonospora nodorum]KAH3988621.1 hypothetical protein HBH52_027460 [Parastagonospora nodorum]KAH4037286.1 hypothetical protein HBI09_068480 [Parastagonospora nodorum]KAH4053579.1 hypothetical protein HBH49_085620 [Parastagonospora nodorum]KAH4108018.1 hypothetical protein HBH46_051800 [Parastagonospora nodorum]